MYIKNIYSKISTRYRNNISSYLFTRQSELLPCFLWLITDSKNDNRFFYTWAKKIYTRKQLYTHTIIDQFISEGITQFQEFSEILRPFCTVVFIFCTQNTLNNNKRTKWISCKTVHANVVHIIFRYDEHTI